MPKELIVSVNGREKKIAIVDNGKITEFYIERGEGGQGIVGNIYKGRVMRVLPGMQSAFVDIGLERDAFLYVSDFFDEEEEFERIVVDKSKTEGAEAARAHAAEKIERDRIERERQIESAQERVEPAVGTTDDETEEEAGAEELPAAPEIAAAQPVVAAAETEATEAAGGRRGRRRRGKGGRTEEQAQAATAGGGASATQAPRAGGRIEADTPFAHAAGSFERVVDEEAFGEGEMFKDARLQERITDQIRGVEFDLAEPTQGVEVGSVLAANNLAGGGSFERVADEEFDYEAAPREVKRVQPAVAASVAALSESMLDEAPSTTGAPQAFERVSDDEKAVEALPATKGKGARARSGAKSKATTEAAASKSKRATKGATKSAAKKAATKSATKASSKGRATKRGKAASDETGADGASLTDADASVKATRTRGEFARRGGRRRNRRPTAGENGGAEEQSNGHAEPAEPVVETAPVPEAAAPERTERVERTAQTERPARPERAERPERPPRGSGRDRRPESGRASGGRSNTGGRSNEGRSNGGRGESSGREGSNRDGSGRESVGREGGGREHGGRGDRGRGGRDRGTPMITDLLREGQEILVQIAKEPIAQKGARITSHIALPGRFLVYMPTIEHVGVSRKIESDGERQRLRKLIKDIRETEEVPSGGFIVRTAGVGISEQDLRDDARYLVRTWKDIRRVAEKQKAPAMAHKDLDLVQRILRDQLSDDFTAIRVDGEEEYREIVEFINRIQPRLVNRVKLYTREEPILEAYGVQAEIDKAIKPRVWLKSGGYLVINQTEALVAIDVNTGKFVGRGGTRLEDTITRTNLEAVDEIARQIRLRDLGGIIVLDLIDMEERRNRARVMQALQDALRDDKSPTKVLSFNDFGLVIMTRKRVKQSLERTLCSPCPYCTGAGLVKSPQTVCYEILEEARRLSRSLNGEGIKQTTLRINPEVARALHSTERDVLTEIEDYLGAVDITSDAHVHQEQFDFAFI
ncbi:MAG: Rne/Rng family ribonuclease [Pyrinomonadaceae bacterium]